MKRSKWLTRGAPLRRTSIMRSKARELVRLEVDLRKLTPSKRAAKHITKHARRPRFHDFMAWVRELPCLLSGWWPAIEPRAIVTPCFGWMEADHLGDRTINGSFRRAPDSTCGPMCHGHHGERTDSVSCGNGAFAHHPDEPMRAWCDAAIELVQLRAFAAGVIVPDDGGRCAKYQAALDAAGKGIPW